MISRTFDAEGFIALVRRLKLYAEVVFPRFDHSLDLAIAGTGVVETDCDMAIVEGNYLLFSEPPWRALAPLWDLSIWLEESETTLRERCIQRWLDYDHTLEAARVRAETNDMQNFRRIVSARLPADVTVLG